MRSARAVPVPSGSFTAGHGGTSMKARVERHAPLYLVIPLSLAILAVIAGLIGSVGSAVGMAMLAYEDLESGTQ